MPRELTKTDRIDLGRLLTVPEACGHMRLSRTTLYGLMNDGRLSYVKIGKARRIPLTALNALVRANTRSGNGGL